MHLETPRLVLRPWRVGDADAFHAIWGDPEVIFWGATRDLTASRSLLDGLRERSSAMPDACGWLSVAPHGGPIVGNVLLQPAKSLPDDLEIGWHIAKASQGRGYATEAAQAVLSLGFERFDHPRIIALIMPTNAPSQRVATRLGMTSGERVMHAEEPHDIWSIDRAAFTG